MTLKQKFLNSPCEKGYVNTNEHRVENNIKVADEYAIGFAIWLLKKSEKYDSYLKLIRDSKQLLEIYKKEKGL